MGLAIIDANGNAQTMSTTEDTSNFLVGSTCVTDPTSGKKQAVGQAHNLDGNALPGNDALVANVGLDFNGTTYDRHRGNVDLTLITLNAQGPGTVNSLDTINFNGKGIQIGVNVTAKTGSPTLVVTLKGKDVASGQYYTLIASGNITTTGFVLLTLYPASLAAGSGGNVTVNQILPRTFQVSAVVSGASTTITGTIGGSIIV